MRLHAALKAAKYYEMIHGDLTLANMIWSVLKSFEDQWDALVERKYSNDPKVTNLTKDISAPKLLESFYLYLRMVVGKHGITLYYVVHNLLAVYDPAPPLIDGDPYSEEHGIVEDELIFRASNVHSLFKQDAADVFQRRIRY